MSQQQRDHVKRYVSNLSKWKRKNLGERMCHELAAVDAWLDERYPVRTKKAESNNEGASSLFDSLPRAW
jgi:hypothetical protein